MVAAASQLGSTEAARRYWQERGLGGSGDAATAAVIARCHQWQRGSRAAAVGSAAAAAAGCALAWQLQVATWRRRPASLAARRQRSLGGSGDAAMAAVIARWQRWQRGSRAATAGSAAAAAAGSALVAQHWRASAATAVLPQRAAAVAMKTLVATVMAEAQTINNQLKAVTVMVTETAMMKATTKTIETKGRAAVVEAQ